MPTIIKGNPDAQLQAVHQRFDKAKGWSVEYEYEGSKAAIDKLVAENPTADMLDRSDDVGVSARCRIGFSNGDAVVGDAEDPVFDTWELTQNDLEKSVYQHQNTFILSATEIAAVKKAAEQSLQEDNFSPDFLICSTQAQRAQTMLYKHVLYGYDGFLLPQYVLRRTTYVGSNYAGALDFANVYKLFTTAQVKAAESIPTTIMFDLDEIDANLPPIPAGTFMLPDGYVFPDASVVSGSNHPVFGYAWMKRSPTKTQEGPNRFALRYEYWHAAWSRWLYYGVT